MRKDEERKEWSSYVGWSSQALGWWLLELLEELPRSKKNKKKQNTRLMNIKYILKTYISEMYVLTIVFVTIICLGLNLKCVRYSLCPLGKGWESWGERERQLLNIFHDPVCYFILSHNMRMSNLKNKINENDFFPGLYLHASSMRNKHQNRLKTTRTFHLIKYLLMVSPITL